MITAGMWIHVLLNALTCHTPTRNPIWGELRTVAVVYTTAAVWCILWATTAPNLPHVHLPAP